jgi:hypothetical protein
LFKKFVLKKIILLLGVLGSFVVNTFAQTTYDISKLEGTWINNDLTDATLEDPTGKTYPIIKHIRGQKPKAINAALKQKLLSLREILFTAFPKPFTHSFIYSLVDLNENSKNLFALKFQALRKSNLKLSTQKDASLIAAIKEIEKTVIVDPVPLEIKINTIEPEFNIGLFVRNILLSTAAEIAKIKSFTGIFMIPPHNNYEEAKNGSANYTYPTYVYKNGANNYFVFRHIFQYTGLTPQSNMQEDAVVLTYNGKLPYEPITRGMFIDLLDAHFKENQKKVIANVAIEKVKSGNQGANTVKQYADMIKEAEVKVKTIEALRKAYSNSLNLPATILPKHRYLVDGQLDDYIHGKIGDVRDAVGVFPEKLIGVFTDDIKNGYSPSLATNFFKSNKQEDIQIIQFTWKSIS